MKIYRIFLKKTNEGLIEDLEIVKEGFSIFAFIFQIFYLMYKRLWLQSIIIFVIFSFLNILQATIVSQYIIIPINICVCIYIGFEYIDWLTKKLIKNGYEFLGYSSGNDKKEAKLKFLESINENYTSNDKMEQKIF